MKERIEQIKTLYAEAADYQHTMSIAPIGISKMKADLVAQIQSLDDGLKDTIIALATSDKSTQYLVDDLNQRKQLEHALDVLTKNESEAISKVDYMVKGVYRKAEAMLRTLIYEVIADDIDTNEVNLILNELGEYLKPNQAEWLNETLPEPTEA